MTRAFLLHPDHGDRRVGDLDLLLIKIQSRPTVYIYAVARDYWIRNTRGCGFFRRVIQCPRTGFIPKQPMQQPSSSMIEACCIGCLGMKCCFDGLIVVAVHYLYVNTKNFSSSICSVKQEQLGFLKFITIQYWILIFYQNHGNRPSPLSTNNHHGEHRRPIEGESGRYERTTATQWSQAPISQVCAPGQAISASIGRRRPSSYQHLSSSILRYYVASDTMR